MKISIPKPCSENWDDMLPDEKGKFCLQCTKTVVDFSQKSKDEIKSFFKESTSKICGRFSVDQLEKVSNRSISSFRNNFQSRISKFAIAVYLVFGGFLFSCSTEQGTLGEANVETIQGEIQAPDETQFMGKVVVKDSTVHIKESKKVQKKACTKEMIMGDTLVESPQVPTIKGDVMYEE